MIFKKTVNSLISDIARKIEHLHDVADKHDEDAEVHEEKVAYHASEMETSQAEAGRARRIAKKFSALIEVE